MFNGTTTFDSTATGLSIQAIETDDGVFIEVTPRDCEESFLFECEHHGDAIALIVGLQREGMPSGRDRAGFLLRHRWVRGDEYVLEVQDRLKVSIGADGEFDAAEVL